MKKKGFTLIELLAVIVILAIIALIATPIVMNLIGKARVKSAEDSAYGILKSAENFFAESLLDDDDFNDITFECTEVNESGNKSNKCINGTKELEFNGTKPTAGRITITRNGNILINEPLVINGYSCDYKEGSTNLISCAGTNSNTTTTALVIPTYEEGQIIYFNPINGNVCTETDYNDNADKLGTTGCMKWYAIENSDSSKTTVNLLLDHNIGSAPWVSGNNFNGPVDVITQLYSLTDSWSDNLIREDSYIFDYYNTKGVSYTIDYSNHKARLISIEEVVSLTNIQNFTISGTTTCYENSQYPYLNGEYYTSSANPKSSSGAWIVSNTANPCTNGIGINVAYIVASFGIRPVITIDKM